MATELSVYNQALDMVSAKPVTAVNQATASAEACARNFDQALEEFLRSHQWSFAQFRAELDLVSPVPAFGWDNRFLLPEDFISLVKLNGTEISNRPGDFYEIEAGYILTDESEAKIVYIRKPLASGGITAAGLLALMDPLAVGALSTLLAAKIAPALRQDGQATAQQLLLTYRQVALPDARRYGGSERKDRRYDPASESNFIRARYSRAR